MNWKELLGFVAGALTTAAFMPQVWRLFRLRSAREISLPFTLLFLVGAAAWLGYGLLLNTRPLILWNVVTLVLVILMLYAKLRWGK